MRRVNLRVAGCARLTGGWITEALLERDVVLTNLDRAEAVICYGLGMEGTTRLPVLNARAGYMDKFTENEALRFNGVPVPQMTRSSALITQPMLPVLGRELRHRDGQDIKLLKTLQDVRDNPCSFYSKFIRSRAEYRVGMFKNEVVCVYGKFRDGATELRAGEVSRSYKDGWRFQTVENYNPRLVSIGRNAVNAVQYDFGAVDIIESMDGELVALEVNSAPGVASKHSLWFKGFVEHTTQWLNTL